MWIMLNIKQNVEDDVGSVDRDANVDIMSMMLNIMWIMLTVGIILTIMRIMMTII